MNHDHYPNSLIREILREVKVIAMVGASANWNRPSYFAMKYLQRKGFRVIPVNPNEAGTEILGETVYAKLGEIPEAIDMVDVFRGAEAALGIADEAIEIGARVLWMQLGVRNDAAAERADARARRPGYHHRAEARRDEVADAIAAGLRPASEPQRIRIRYT